MTKNGEGRIQEDRRKAHFQTLYWCDPEKNVGCKKQDCFWNGGNCRITYRRSWAVLDGGMPAVAKIIRIEGRK